MKNKSYLVIFVTLTLLFAFRVIAQFIQKYFPMDLLPPFEAWQGSGLPYPWLLFFQGILLALAAWQILLVAKDRIVPSRKAGNVLLIIGLVYYGSMLFRLIAGFTFASHNHWFAAKIPSFFHLVLASFILVLAHYHRVKLKPLATL